MTCSDCRAWAFNDIMKTPIILFAVIALVATPASAATKEAPSRPAGKQCKWEKVADATLGLEANVQRCDYGFRRIHLYAEGNALLMHYSDGGEDEKLIETFVLKDKETPRDGIKRVFDEHTPDKSLAARCLVQPYRGEGPVPEGAKRYTILPNAALKKELDAKQDPGDIPEPPCGEWGDMPDSVQYYEAQEGVGRIMIVRAGQDEPMFDEKTLRLLPPKE
jgi:hypothetical protein